MTLVILTALLAAQAPAAGALRAPGVTAPVNVLITLTEEPPALAFDRVKAASTLPAPQATAAAKAAGEAQARKVKQQQDRLLDAVKRPPYRATVIYRLARATNAIAISVDGARLSELRTLPGVKTVRILQTEVPTRKERPATLGTPPAAFSLS
jgi:hypothetical protein